MKLRSLVPNFCISCIGERFIYSHNRSADFAALHLRTDRVGIHKSLQDSRMKKLVTRLSSFISRNICFEFSVQCICSAGYMLGDGNVLTNKYIISKSESGLSR